MFAANIEELSFDNSKGKHHEISNHRLDMLLATASVAGGLRLGEPGSDLGVCLALASAHAGTPLAGDLIACAEVGLGGELRLVGHTPRRLAEAARLGFRRAIVPKSAPDVDAPIELLRATNLGEALALSLSAATSRSGRSVPARQEVGALPLV